MKTHPERPTPPAHHPVHGMTAAPLALLALLVALALGTGACKGSDSPYYDFNPNTNSNEYPYFVDVRTESVTVDQEAGVAHIVAIYRPFPPVSTCATLPTSELRYDVDIASMAGSRASIHTIEPAAATPISEDEFQARSVAITYTPYEDREALFVGPDGSTWRVGDVQGHQGQYFAPPYAMNCGELRMYRMVEDSQDASYVHSESVGAAILLCGYCGEPRCGDSLCTDGETVDTCREDCL